MDKLITDRLWEDNEEQFLQLLRIPSVFDPDTVSEEAPYGKYSKEALMYMKDMLEQNGFSVTEYGNQVICAEVGEGKDEERIDLISHLDVVAPGEGWTYPPFDAMKTDGKIYGRGTQDMKSGAWLTYLALRYLRDNGLLGNRKVRLVYGSDEEITMNDMKIYADAAGMPAFAFTPDGQFPMAIGEKGIILYVMTGRYSGIVKELRGGIQTNVISPEAVALLDSCDIEKVQDYLDNSDIDGKAELTEQGIKLTVYGISAHASKPELGRNATVDLLKIVSDIYDDPFIRRHYDFFRDPYGKGADIAYDIPPMGKLTMNLGILNISNGDYYAEIDGRYPYGADSDDMGAKFRNAFPELNIEVPYHERPTLQDESSPYIQALKCAYENATGKPCISFISGGVSYSKVIDNCVSFGTTPEDEEYLAHQKDEYITVDNMKMILGMYIDAIGRLSKI